MKLENFFWIFTIYAISICMAQVSFSQNVENDTRNKRRVAFANFISESTLSTSRWDYESDRLETIFDKILQVSSGTPVEFVEDFIASHRGLLGLEKGHSLELEHTSKSSAGGIRFWYQQYYKGLKVLSGGYLFAVNRKLHGELVSEDPEGTTPSLGQMMYRSDEIKNFKESRNDWYIYFIKGTFAPDITIETEPEITKELAESSVRAGFGQQISGSVEARLAIQVDKKNPSVQALVYHTVGKVISGGEFEITVDAFSGNILSTLQSRNPGISSGANGIERKTHKYSPPSPYRTSACYPMTDTARIFASHPDNSSLGNFTIWPCSASPQVLDGWFANVTPQSGSRVSGDVTGIEDEDAGWHEISAYFHISAAAEYFYGHGLLDDGDYGDDDVIQIQVGINDTGKNGLAIFEADSISIRENPGGVERSAAFEAAIMAHETAHILIHQVAPQITSCYDINTEACGYHEGLADYMGIIYRNFRRGTVSAPWTDAVIGEYILDPEEDAIDLPRDLTNPDPHLDDLFNTSIYDWTGALKTVKNGYDAGMVLSTALMDFDIAHGNNSFPYVMEMIKSLPTGTLDFEDARDALDAAMTQEIISYNPVIVSGSTYYVECTLDPEVCQSISGYAMYDRGIGSEPSGGAKRGRDKTVYPVIHPVSTKLLPAYPNPFNPITIVRFDVSASTKVTIKIIDVLGRHIETLISSQLTPGEHSVTWNGGSHPSGTYFVELTSDQYSSTQKIVLLK